jgi:hypothetical protein
MRTLVSSRYLGSHVHEFAFFLLGCLILYLLASLSGAIFEDHWSKLIPIIYWVGFWYVLWQVLEDAFLKKIFLHFGLMIPALLIFATASPAS